MADQRTLDELQRVLTYPQLKLTPGMISERYARYSSLVTVFPEGEAALPAARTATTRNSSNCQPAAVPMCWSARTRPCSNCGRTKLAFQIVGPALASRLITDSNDYIGKTVVA